MNTVAKTSERPGNAILDALPHPVLLVDAEGGILEANTAAQTFFQASVNVLRRHPLAYFVPFGSPLLALIEQVRTRGAPVSEYRVDVGTPRNGGEHLVDIYATPSLDQPGSRRRGAPGTLDGRQDRPPAHLARRGAQRQRPRRHARARDQEPAVRHPRRGAASGILRRATEDRELTRLIRDEADRIVKLVDRMEVFSDERPIEREPVNIHSVLDHVRRLASTGFASAIRIGNEYDPSLPMVYANRDQLVQVFLNLVKNAAESIGDAPDGEIVLTTAFRPGFRLSVPGNQSRVTLPLEFCVRDNGPGVPEELVSHLFEPFVTTKANGTGLGLALVAKIIRDHGGIIECESQPRRPCSAF